MLLLPVAIFSPEKVQTSTKGARSIKLFIPLTISQLSLLAPSTPAASASTAQPVSLLPGLMLLLHPYASFLQFMLVPV